jgi:hypothetical protein
MQTSSSSNPDAGYIYDSSDEDMPPALYEHDEAKSRRCRRVTGIPVTSGAFTSDPPMTVIQADQYSFAQEIVSNAERFPASMHTEAMEVVNVFQSSQPVIPSEMNAGSRVRPFLDRPAKKKTANDFMYKPEVILPLIIYELI